MWKFFVKFSIFTCHISMWNAPITYVTSSPYSRVPLNPLTTLPYTITHDEMGPEKLHHKFKSGNEAEPASELESENRNLVATIQEKGSCFFPSDVLKLSLQWSFIGHCKVYFYFWGQKIRSNFASVYSFHYLTSIWQETLIFKPRALPFLELFYK